MKRSFQKGTDRLLKSMAATTFSDICAFPGDSGQHFSFEDAKVYNLYIKSMYPRAFYDNL